LTEQSCEIVEETSTSAISRLRDTVKWFHWKNIGLAGVIAILSTLTISLYLTDEMPWEKHRQVAVQRQYGEALINAWPTLSEEERQRIISHANKKLV